jgi:hypothetical protein
VTSATATSRGRRSPTIEITEPASVGALYSFRTAGAMSVGAYAGVPYRAQGHTAGCCGSSRAARPRVFGLVKAILDGARGMPARKSQTQALDSPMPWSGSRTPVVRRHRSSDVTREANWSRRWLKTRSRSARATFWRCECPRRSGPRCRQFVQA